MSKFRIEIEWSDPLGARGDELKATWARFAINIDGKNVTRLYDSGLEARREAVYLPLYPLAEWLVEKWWSLWNESFSCERRDYDDRHSLSKAREGYALPPMYFEHVGMLTCVSWRREELQTHRIEFLDSGEAWIETNALKNEFSKFIEIVTNRLTEKGVYDSRLQQEWTAIRTIDKREEAFCKVAGALGLDPYDLEEKQQLVIEYVGNHLPAGIIPEFFKAAHSEAEHLEADAKDVLNGLAGIRKSTLNLSAVAELRAAVGSEFKGLMRPGMEKPWDQGYLLAHRLQSHLSLNGQPLKVEQLLGISQNNLGQVFESFSSKNIPFFALLGINAKKSPMFVLKPGMSPESQRFTICRALFEYFYATDDNALITNAETDKQKRNRAFAAELLAPAESLRNRISGHRFTENDIEDIAGEYGVSDYVIRHQLRNHRIAELPPV